MSFTETIAIGRLVADPEIRTYGNDGKSLARFRVAVDLGRDKSAFYNCVAFDKTAEVIQNFCKKGKQVMVAGQFQNSDYDKDVNGTTVRMYNMELNVQRLVLLQDAGGQGGGQARQGGYQQQPRQNQSQQGGYQQRAPQASQPQNGFGGFGGQAQPPAADPFANSGFGGFNSEDDLPF